MRVTIIPSDQTIGVDGRFLRFAFAADRDIHAIQWNGDSGHMEFEDGSPNRALAASHYNSVVKPFVDHWLAEAARIDNPPPPSQEQQQAAITEAITARLAAFAAERGWDTLDRALGQTGAFAADAQIVQAAYDDTWLAALAIFAEVEAGTREMPGVEEFLELLPKLKRPEPVELEIEGPAD